MKVSITRFASGRVGATVEIEHAEIPAELTKGYDLFDRVDKDMNQFIKERAQELAKDKKNTSSSKSKTKMKKRSE